MIKFFRKIRQQLLTENKFSKYLIYAIGEIALVVIGILIALQVNNRNEDSKMRKLEQDYYCRLTEDSNQDVIRIEQYIEETKTRLQNCNELLSLLQNGEVKKKVIINKWAVSTSRLVAIFQPNTSAFDDLTSSGNINIINDVNIKSMMNEYYAFIDGFIKVAERNSHIALDVFFNKEDYFDAGWNELISIYGGIDTTLVNKSILNKEKDLSDKMIKKNMSDVIFHIAINYRNLQRYRMMAEEIQRVNQLLKQKCN